MKFNRRSAPIDAMQFIYTTQDIIALRNFCNGQLREITFSKNLAEVVIDTGEVATEGDWIVKGTRNGFYVIEEAIFDSLYVAVKLETICVCKS